MVNRINLILQAKNITSKQFAEEIGIQPSAMSHILSGRNNPSLGVVMKIVTCYPEIDINWLMFGKGEMYITNRTTTNAANPVQINSSKPQIQHQQEAFDLFSPADEVSVPKSTTAPLPSKPIIPTPTSEPPSGRQSAIDSSESLSHLETAQTNCPTTSPEVSQAPLRENCTDDSSKAVHPNQAIFASTKKIAKIIVMYTDHSFSEYFPE